MPIDLVNRFAVTPMQSIFNWSGKVIAIATNSPILLNRMADLAPQCAETCDGQIDCSWRIVTEAVEESFEFDGLSSRYVSNGGISFLTIGPRSFLAYDETGRKGISFISENFVRDPTLFVEAFLPSFASLLQNRKEQW
jgi:hypothetical protein